MSGAVCFYGRRVPIQTLFDYLEGNATVEDFCKDYDIPREQALGVIHLGLEGINERVQAA